MDITAVCERSGNWWAISIPEVDGVFTQARRLDRVAHMAADAVALMLNIPIGEVHVTLDVHVAQDSVKEWAEARRLEAQARQLQDEAAARARSSVAALRADGLSVRDIGTLLDVSSQRVSQLANA